MLAVRIALVFRGSEDFSCILIDLTRSAILYEYIFSCEHFGQVWKLLDKLCRA